MDNPTQINCSGAHIYNNYMLKFTGNLHIKQDLMAQKTKTKNKNKQKTK